MQEIVIKIPEETYRDVIKNGFIYDEDGEVISHAIINGTVLPKGHGRLIDENDFEKRVAIMTKSMDLGYGEIMDIVDEIVPIVEADKESEDKE